MENNDFTLFDYDTEKSNSSHLLRVVKTRFEGEELLTWKDLFSGFDNLYAITFSSGISFIYELIDMFKKADIVFGCEGVLTNNHTELIAHQSVLMGTITDKMAGRKEGIIKRVNDHSLRLYISRNKMSHEKIYLLESEDGRKRVISGSANMSFNAFRGVQRENIMYSDDPKFFDYYMDVFHELKAECSDEISKNALLNAGNIEKLDTLPICETVKAQKMLIVQNDPASDEEIKFCLDVQKLTPEVKKASPKVETKGATIVITPEIIQKTKKTIVATMKAEQKKLEEFPQLVFDIEQHTATLNSKQLDLAPNCLEVKNDVTLFLEYMNAFDRFHGDYAGLQHRYFELFNWMFCSPFMAIMRDTAIRHDHVTMPYPVYGLVYGQSKAGKTSFLETILKMMIGQKEKMSATEFTKSNITGLKQTVKGVPIIVDDLVQTRFNQHAVEIIKDDSFGVSLNMTDYPAVVISANEDVKAVGAELRRRMVVFHVAAGLNNTETMNNSVVRNVQKKIGTAFYREYLRRILAILPDFLEEFKKDSNNITPDILNFSSKVLLDIISEYCDDIPFYIRELSLDDYFGEQVTGKNVIDAINLAWDVNKRAFIVKKKENQLQFDVGDPHDANRILKQLPESLEGKKAGRGVIVMNLKEAKEFFGNPFQKNILFVKKSV